MKTDPGVGSGCRRCGLERGDGLVELVLHCLEVGTALRESSHEVGVGEVHVWHHPLENRAFEAMFQALAGHRLHADEPVVNGAEFIVPHDLTRGFELLVAILEDAKLEKNFLQTQVALLLNGRTEHLTDQALGVEDRVSVAATRGIPKEFRRGIEVIRHGPGPDVAPTLVFLHDGIGCAATWRDFPEALARETGCGALVYSRAGYGGSDPVPLPRPLTYMHDEGFLALPDLLDAAGVRRAYLVGHSDGGSIALLHASTPRALPRVRGLLLEAPHVFCEEITVRSIEAARGDLGAAEADADAVRVAVVADTVRAYVDATSSAERLAVAQRTVDLLDRSIRITGARFDAGRSDRLDVIRVTALRDQQKALVPSLAADRDAALFRLATLTGRTPQDLPADIRASVTTPTLAQPIPVGDGRALLARRPDVRAAERRLAADTARIGVATADLYPRISLGGTIGTTAIGGGDILGGGPLRWVLGPLINWAFPNQEAIRARIGGRSVGGATSKLRIGVCCAGMATTDMTATTAPANVIETATFTDAANAWRAPTVADQLLVLDALHLSLSAQALPIVDAVSSASPRTVAAAMFTIEAYVHSTTAASCVCTQAYAAEYVGTVAT